MDAHVAADELRAALRGRALPDIRDVLDQRIDLRAGKVRRGGGEEPRIECQLAAVRGDRQGIVLPGIDILMAETVAALLDLGLQCALRLRHRTGDDDGLAALEPRTRQICSRFRFVFHSGFLSFWWCDGEFIGHTAVPHALAMIERYWHTQQRVLLCSCVLLHAPSEPMKPSRRLVASSSICSTSGPASMAGLRLTVLACA